MFDNKLNNEDMNDFDREFNEAFTENLKTVLEHRGRTQAWLADTIGVSPITISRYFSGNRVPKISVVYAMSKVLNISMDELCSLDGLDKDITRYDIHDIDEFLDNKFFNRLWNGRVVIDGQRLSQEEYTFLESIITMAVNQIRINREDWSKSQIYPTRYN